jgi:hypothetical protein
MISKKEAVIRASKWQKQHKEYRRRYMKKYRKKNKQKLLKLKYNWWLKNKVRLRKYKNLHARKYYRKNRQRVIKNAVLYNLKREKIDPIFKLQRLLRHRLSNAIKRNSRVGSAVKDLGCKIQDFKKYIEQKFYSNMSWSNWGSIWELDHKKALCKFDLTKRTQFKEAVHYKNLQPLTIKDHRKKSTKDTK